MSAKSGAFSAVFVAPTVAYASGDPWAIPMFGVVAVLNAFVAVLWVSASGSRRWARAAAYTLTLVLSYVAADHTRDLMMWTILLLPPAAFLAPVLVSALRHRKSSITS